MTYLKIVRAQSSEQESLDQLRQKKSDLMTQQKHKTDQRCVYLDFKFTLVLNFIGTKLISEGFIYTLL